MSLQLPKSRHINPAFYSFINDDVLPHTPLEANKFWDDFNNLLDLFTPINRQLLQTRSNIQTQIDAWHISNKGQKFDPQTYFNFLKDIGYIVEQGEDFTIETTHVDREISTIAGPQLVVPINNARFALNAANARWGSLYDALYGTDVIPQQGELKAGKEFNAARGDEVIKYAKDFLDQRFPLAKGSHHDVANYLVYYHHLLVLFKDGTTTGLKTPRQFAALSGSKNEPTSILLQNNGLHIEIRIDRSGSNGTEDLACVQDIIVESAVTTIMDFEDSVTAVDAEDKIEAYRNWLGLIRGTLEATFTKNGSVTRRKMEKNKRFTTAAGEKYHLPGRALLLARNVGHLMDTELMQDEEGYFAPEGIIDAIVTSLISSIDLLKDDEKQIHNSKTDSIYIVKPKMHGPEEVKFTVQLFSAVEDMLNLERNTIKLGIMDEERRTTVNLKECIREAKHRIVFINTGFLDRTGDEIHTSMQAGAFLTKSQIKEQPWISAYEDWNVDIGLACGFQGKAQIGKGMWAMPDEMSQMMEQKIAHPRAGANTAWVPSPTAATLHALHYHQVNVAEIQEQLKNREQASLNDILTIPLMADNQSLSREEVEREIENNIQGILGYVVRWVELGIGCSKVPDINHIGLMEDRATLRISSQHIANWLRHNICTKTQVNVILKRMAAVVDEQNTDTQGYQPMSSDLENNMAFKAASELIFAGIEQPNGYTEPLLHHYRQLVKNKS
ncbi:MAG: malate synthase G [Gammaproteobacteria bacterium]|nr:MAG: malate synthase G [Gammaproteobacteria bacterium]